MPINTNFIHPDDAAFLIKASQKSFLSDKALDVRTYENADICPGEKHGGVWINQKHLQHTFVDADSVLTALPPPPQSYCNEEVVFIGTFCICWGHCISDHLKHLWFYFDERFQHLKKLKFVYTPFSLTATQPKNFWDLLKSIGFPIENIQIIDKPTRFARIYVPDACFFCNMLLKNCKHYTKEYLNLLNRLPNLKPPKNLNIEKVYFSRTKFLNPTKYFGFRDYNEIEVENIFKNQGFNIFYPEKLDFLTELAILQNCKVFSATDGSIGHNVLFCKNAKQILLLRKSRKVTGYQLTFNSIMLQNNPNIEIIYMDCTHSYFADKSESWCHGPFFYYETKYLSRYFGSPQKPFPHFKYLQFLRLVYFPWTSFIYLDRTLLTWTHPIRAKLKIGTRLRRFFKKNP